MKSDSLRALFACYSLDDNYFGSLLPGLELDRERPRADDRRVGLRPSDVGPVFEFVRGQFGILDAWCDLHRPRLHRTSARIPDSRLCATCDRIHSSRLRGAGARIHDSWLRGTDIYHSWPHGSELSSCRLLQR